MGNKMEENSPKEVEKESLTITRTETGEELRSLIDFGGDTITLSSYFNKAKDNVPYFVKKVELVGKKPTSRGKSRGRLKMILTEPIAPHECRYGKSYCFYTILQRPYVTNLDVMLEMSTLERKFKKGFAKFRGNRMANVRFLYLKPLER